MLANKDQFDSTLFEDVRNAVDGFAWLVALWPDWEDSGHWEDTIVLISVVQTPVFHLPQQELRRVLAPVENKHRVIFDPIMYFPTNAPHTDEATDFIICRENFHPNCGYSFSYAVDDPVNQSKIDRLAAFGDIVETNPEIRNQIKSRLEYMDEKVSGGAHLVVEEWITIMNVYDDAMLAKLFKSKNRRTQELAVTHPLPRGYFQHDYGFSPEVLDELQRIALES